MDEKSQSLNMAFCGVVIHLVGEIGHPRSLKIRHLECNLIEKLVWHGLNMPATWNHNW